MRFSKLCYKIGLKNATDVNIFEFAKKADLVSLKSDIDKLDADKVDMIN